MRGLLGLGRVALALGLLTWGNPAGAQQAAPPAEAPVASPQPPSPQPQPQPAPGTGPTTMPYRAGDPVPPGYRVEERPRKGLVIAGWVVTAVPYGLGLMAATSAGFENRTAYLAVPWAGPWLTLGQREYCEPDRSAAENVDCVGDVFIVMGLVASGIVQTAGGTLLLVGYMATKDTLVREDQVLHVGPMRVGSGYGLGVGGAF